MWVMDAFVGVLDGPRARGAFALRSVMSPPWSLRILAESPLTLIAIVKGEAWVVKILPPPNDYAYWGFVITNPWLESYDYFRTTTHLTNETGVKNPDGSMTIVVAQEDPGVPNWLDCGSRLEGYAILRWTLAGDQVPDPECKVIPLEDVKAGGI